MSEQNGSEQEARHTACELLSGTGSYAAIVTVNVWCSVHRGWMKHGAGGYESYDGKGQLALSLSIRNFEDKYIRILSLRLR